VTASHDLEAELLEDGKAAQAELKGVSHGDADLVETITGDDERERLIFFTHHLKQRTIINDILLSPPRWE
jgi:hypothetical protein